MSITFDKNSGHYRTAGGRVISDAQINQQINNMVEASERNFRAISQNLTSGKINLAEFQVQFAEAVKTGHLVAAAVGAGGRNQMTVSDWGSVGAAVKEQYQFLNRFAREIEHGRLSSNQIEFRAGLYSKSIRSIYMKSQKKLKGSVGKSQCARILHARESCLACARWAAKGFVDIDEQPPIGGLMCKDFCLCTLEYR